MMTDQLDALERMLERRITARASVASRPVDAAAIARAAIATTPPRRLFGNGVLPMRASFAWVVVLTLLVAAVAGGAVLVGALLRAPAPPLSLLAIGSSGGFLFANADGSDPRQVTNDGPYFVPQWSADGTMVATTAVIGDEGNMLTIFGADGARLARIPGVTDLRWSPVADALAISGFPEPWLQVLSPGRGSSGEAAAGVRSLSLPPQSRRILGFDWAPDGRRLAVAIVTGADPDARPTLWLVPADGGPAEAVPGDGRLPTSFPAWSPDGHRIAVMTDRCDGDRDCPSIVRILDADTGVRRAEVEQVWEPATVRWSPDGTMLAVDALMPDDSALRQQREVFVYTLADNAVRRMTDTPGGRTWLVGWAPDGASLLVSREVGPTGAREAWQIDAASGAGRLLADDAYGVALQPLP